MAAPQLGDLVKFAELAWRVYDYGWSEELNANRQFMEFGEDLSYLGRSLEKLEDVINSAKYSFRGHGQTLPDHLGWDEDSLADIIGDYSGTLNDCMRLVQDNKNYMTAITGPGANIHWNVFVQPQVERLRRRILLHNTKIQHVLRPFEIDLRMRIYKDLEQRISMVHEGVRLVHHDLRKMYRALEALMHAFDPSLLGGLDQPETREIHEVHIPEIVEEAFQASFESHPDREKEGFDFRVPPLREIADAFIENFDKATKPPQPDTAANRNSTPPEDQYLALLASQFLMTKMLESPEYTDPLTVSHWPRYIESLRQNLSNACLRFSQDVEVPPLLDRNQDTQFPSFWCRQEPAAYIDSFELPIPMELIAEMDLVAQTPEQWQNLKLFRFTDSTDRNFRLIITGGDKGDPVPSQTLPVDFDISKASLIPLYAYDNPDDTEPLVLVLNDSRNVHRLAFQSRSDLYTFQQALTAYEVIDEYMAYRLQVIFVIGSSQRLMHAASMQLWRPNRLAERSVVSGDSSSDSGSARRLSTASSIGTARQAPSPRSAGTNPSDLHLPQASRQAGYSPQEARQTDPGVYLAQFAPGPSTKLSLGQQPVATARRSSSRFLDIMPSSSTATGPSGYSSNTVPAPTITASIVPEPRWSMLTNRFTSSTPPYNRRNSTMTTSSTAAVKPTRHRAKSIISVASTTSTHACSVSISGSPTVADTGTLHTMPTEPLLVLFTHNPQTNTPSVVALSVDPKTRANYHACNCASRSDCLITALERGAGGRPLKVFRVAEMDVLPLAEALRGQRGSLIASRTGGRAWRNGLTRVSICFVAVERRMEFAGMPCQCPGKTEVDLMECLRLGHRGRLGLLKELYRRDMVAWNEGRHGNNVNVVRAVER